MSMNSNLIPFNKYIGLNNSCVLCLPFSTVFSLMPYLI